METKESFTFGRVRDETDSPYLHTASFDGDPFQSCSQTQAVFQTCSKLQTFQTFVGIVLSCHRMSSIVAKSNSEAEPSAANVLQTQGRAHWHSKDTVSLVGVYLKQHVHLCTDVMEVDQILVRQLGVVLSKNLLVNWRFDGDAKQVSGE